MNQGILLSKKALVAPFFLWLNANQVYARVGSNTIPISRSLATDDTSCYPVTKAVKIETANGKMLYMAEVQALSLDDVDVASSGNATQSSTQWPASNAIDGHDWSISQTSYGDPNPWWQVDLASSSSLKSVDITLVENWDYCKLSGATVSLTNELGEVVDAKILGNTCGVTDISLNLSSCTTPSSTPTVSPVVTTSAPTASPVVITSTPTASPVVTVTQVVSAPASTDADPLCYPETKSVKIESANKQILNMVEVKALSLDDENVALDGTASQSSTLGGASNAIDGNEAQYSFSHTSYGDQNPWWQIDFDSSSSLKSVDIKNRYCSSDPNCLCRLSGATVYLTDELGELVDTKTLGNTCEMNDISVNLSTCSPSSADADPSCYPEIKSVKIETANKQVLNMVEFKALSLDDVNVASSGTVTQSSTLGDASYATDGYEWSISHTSNGDQTPWWQVELASSSSLKSVDIKNRFCPNASTCLCRLSGATVSLTNDLGEVVGTKTLGNTCEMNDISLDLSTCGPPSNNAEDVPLITFNDVLVTSDDSFEITFNNPLDQTEIYAAVVSNSFCNADNSDAEVNSATQNVFVGSSSATIVHSISELITAEQKNTGSAFLKFCLRADVRAAGFPSSLLASKMSLGITVNFEDESGIVLNDPSSGFKIEVVTADFEETIVEHTSKREVNVSAVLGECAAPGNAGPYAVGSTLKFCVKSVDSDVVISSLNDVSFTDLEGNPILGITDASGEPSYVTAINGIDSKEVDVSTMMATTIFDQGYGGTTIHVQGTVSVTYVDEPSARSRQLETEERKPFSFEIAVGEAAIQQEDSYYTNSAKPVVVGAIIAGVAAVGMIVVSVMI